jgi:hypothetical protein
MQQKVRSACTMPAAPTQQDCGGSPHEALPSFNMAFGRQVLVEKMLRALAATAACAAAPRAAASHKPKLL